MTELSIVPLPRDLKAAAATLGKNEVRYLVDSYYQLQDFRKASANQARALTESEEPHDTVAFFATQFGTLEEQIKRALDSFSAGDSMGAWSREHVGIGPVIAAGLVAHIDITKAPTVGHIWRFAGLDPTVTWGKGQKRPWNADLKVLCWKIGDSFVKFSGRDDCFYGQIYKQRKVYELDRDNQVRQATSNDADDQVFNINGVALTGGNAKASFDTLNSKNIKDKETLKLYHGGHLPPGRLDLRARRYAVKLFLAHWHGEAYRQHYGTEPPLPYAIAHLGHAHEIKSPV